MEKQGGPLAAVWLTNGKARMGTFQLVGLAVPVSPATFHATVSAHQRGHGHALAALLDSRTDFLQVLHSDVFRPGG